VSARSERIGFIVLAVAFAGLGVWGLGDGEYVQGPFYIASAVVWTLYAVFNERLRAFRRRRQGRRPTGS
jgi:hypothetical protein